MNDSYAHICEQSLGRLASSMEINAVSLPAFQYIPSMLVNYDWRMRHAGLMAIAAVVVTRKTFLWFHREGLVNGGSTMNTELGKIVG